MAHTVHHQCGWCGEVTVHHCAESIAPEPKPCQYRWEHKPTGTTGMGAVDHPISRKAFVQLLERWNASNPEVWRYEEI